MPFASQAVFLRADSRGANDYRTTYEHLCRYWQSNARLLPPYTTPDLADFTHTSIPPEHYRPMSPAKLEALTGQRAAEEETAEISAAEVALLARKLNAFRWLLWLLFWRRFAFRLGEHCFEYDPAHGWLRDRGITRGGQGDFVVEVPKLTMKEALRNNHLTDLGITMFVRIRPLRRIDPRKAYGLFVLFQFDDYGHLAGIGALLRWLRRGIRYSFVLRLHPPPRPVAPRAG